MITGEIDDMRGEYEKEGWQTWKRKLEESWEKVRTDDEIIKNVSIQIPSKDFFLQIAVSLNIWEYWYQKI